jgi:hypothetical protein
MLAVIAASVMAMAVQAADKAPATPQQQVVRTCSATANARVIKAQDRNRFLASCISEGRKREKQVAKACSEAADYKQVHERKKFMVACVKG